MLTVFGSIIVDNLYCVPSLPQEGETVLATDLYIGPGGKGANQAVAAAKSGGTVTMIGTVGSDEVAHICLNALESAGVDNTKVAKSNSATGSATVLLDSKGANAIAVAPAANKDTTAAQLDDETLQHTTTLLMQMEIPLSVIEAAIFAARDRGITSILNLAPAAPLSLAALQALSILIVNEIELEMLAGFVSITGSSHWDLGKKIADLLGHPLVITLGKEGAVYIDQEKSYSSPALDIVPIDTTGAGDAFCGVFAASLDQHYSVEESLHRGCIAGSLACLKTGAQESHPSKKEIERYL